jgi:predicted nucleotidyltransferase
VRPIAITSPTDFICVVSVESAVGNFSSDRSDLDLLVDFGEYQPGLARRALAFHREVEQLFQCRVDVLSVHGLRSPHWRALHDAQKVPVYAAA